jgi:ribosomal protein S21
MDDDFIFKKKGMTVKVNYGNIEGAIAQLKRRMNSEGINKELRKRKHFSPNSVLKRQQMSEAKLRWKKKQAQIMEIDTPKKKSKKATKVVNKSVIEAPKNNS